jgi:hypothetical protein
MKKLLLICIVLLGGLVFFIVSDFGLSKKYTFSTFFQPHENDPIVPIFLSLNKDDHDIIRVKLGQVEIQNNSFFPKYYRRDDHFILCFSKDIRPFPVKFDQQANRTETGYFVVDGWIMPYRKMTKTMYFEYKPSELDQSIFSSVSQAKVLANSTCALMDVQKPEHIFDVIVDTNKIINSNTTASSQLNSPQEGISSVFSLLSKFPVFLKNNFIHWSNGSIGELKVTNITQAKKGVILSFIFACLDNNNLQSPLFLAYIGQDKRRMPFGNPVVDVGTTIFPIHIFDSSEYLKTFSTVFKDKAYVDLSGITGIRISNQSNLKFSVYVSNKLPQSTPQPNCLNIDANNFKKVGEVQLEIR